MKTLIIALNLFLVTSWASAQTQMSFSDEAQAQERGAGSSRSAEIARYQEKFTEVVVKNKELFLEVNIEKLKKITPQIWAVNSEIKTCDHNVELDAFSNLKTEESFYNEAKWLSKSELEKVHIVGHETLVLMEVEKSNTYTVSNRIFKIFKGKELFVKDQCNRDKYICKSLEEIEKNYIKALNFYNSGKIDKIDLKTLDQKMEKIVQMDLIPASKREYSHQGFKGRLSSKNPKWEGVKREVEALYRGHMSSLKARVERALSEEKVESMNCVNLAPSQAKINKQGINIDDYVVKDVSEPWGCCPGPACSADSFAAQNFVNYVKHISKEKKNYTCEQLDQLHRDFSSK